MKSMPTISWLAFGIGWKKGRPLIEILEKKKKNKVCGQLIRFGKEQ